MTTFTFFLAFFRKVSLGSTLELSQRMLTERRKTERRETRQKCPRQFHGIGFCTACCCAYSVRSAGDQQGGLHRHGGEFRHGLFDQRGYQDGGGCVQGCRRPYRRHRQQGLQGLRTSLQRGLLGWFVGSLLAVKCVPPLLPFRVTVT